MKFRSKLANSSRTLLRHGPDRSTKAKVAAPKAVLRANKGGSNQMDRIAMSKIPLLVRNPVER